MEKLNDMYNGFSNLHNYSRFAPQWITGSSTVAQNGWTGKDVDVMAIDRAIDPTHYEFTNTETADTRVQLVDWNYLAKHIDRLVLSGSDGWDEFRARDFTFAQMHSYISHLIESQDFPDVVNSVEDIGEEGIISNPEVSYVRGDIYKDIKNENPTPEGIDVTGSMDYIDPATGHTVGFSSSMCAYVPDHEHGTHTAGTVSGRTMGWAHEANVYHLASKWYSGFRWNDASDEELVYYLQILKKAAGIDNPLIINNSYGFGRNTGAPSLYNDLVRATTSSYDVVPQPDREVVGLDGEVSVETGYTWESTNPVENVDAIDALVNNPWELTHTATNNRQHLTRVDGFSGMYPVGNTNTASTAAFTSEEVSVIVPGWSLDTYRTTPDGMTTTLFRFIASDPLDIPSDSESTYSGPNSIPTLDYYFAYDSVEPTVSMDNLKAKFDSNMSDLGLAYNTNEKLGSKNLWVRLELNKAADLLSHYVSVQTGSVAGPGTEIIDNFQVSLPVIGKSYSPWELYTGSLSQEGNPALRSQLQTMQNFLGRYKWQRYMYRFGTNGTIFPGTGSVADKPQRPYNYGKFNRHWYISDMINKRYAKVLFRDQSMEEGAIWVYSSGNGHSVMNSISALRESADFENTCSVENTSVLFSDPNHGFAYPTASGTAPFIDPGPDTYFASGIDGDALRYSTNYWQDPGFYAHTRSWDEYKDGVLVQENVHTMGWMPMGDLPTALVADDKVICVGASDCTFLKDPAMYFDERGDRDIDWDKTGVQAYANSEGWPNYPDDTLHVHGIHSSIAHQYITEELDWPGHRLSKYEEPFGTFGYKPHQNGEVFSPRTSSFFPGDYENQSYYNSVAHEAWLNMGGPLNHLKPSMKVTSYNRAIRTLRSADRMAVDQKATFSNTGPRVDIWAPGVNILSSIPYNFMQPDCIEHMYDMSKRDYPKSRYTTPGLLSGGASLKLDTYLTQSNIGAFIMKETSTAQGRSGRIYSKYGQRSGTSMAGPQVVGLLALYAQKKRDLTQAEAKDWLQTHAYRNYIPDTTNCTPYTTQSSLHESVYGDPVMHDTKRVFGTELLDRIPLKKAMQRINPSVYAHLDTDPSSDQVWYEEVEDMEYFRSRLLDQHEYANPRALMGAPNLIAHFPYYNTPIDDVIIPATRSNNMLSNVSLGGSVGVTNIERSYDTVVFDPAAVRAMPLKDSPLVPETSSRV